MTELDNHIKTLASLNRGRHIWLIISSFVAFSVFIIIFEWEKIQEWGLAWIGVSLGITITVIWWYWTMILIRKLLSLRYQEYAALTDLINELNTIKKNLKK